MGSESATRSAEEGADTIAWLGYAPLSELNGNGLFWRDRKLIEW